MEKLKQFQSAVGAAPQTTSTEVPVANVGHSLFLQLLRNSVVKEETKETAKAALAARLNSMNKPGMPALYYYLDSNNGNAFRILLGICGDTSNHYEVFDSEEEAKKVVTALSVTDTAVADKYVSAVSQTNGKINIERTAFRNDTKSSTAINSGATPSAHIQVSVTNKNGGVESVEVKEHDVASAAALTDLSKKVSAIDIDGKLNGLQFNEIGLGDNTYIKTVKQEKGQLSATTKTLVAGTDTILEYTADGIKATAAIHKLTSSELQGLGDANVKEAYRLLGKNKEVLGDTIKVYKDQTLKSATIGKAVPTTEGEPKLPEQDCLILTYVGADGQDIVVNIPLGDFLRQSEFKDGLTVNGAGEVSVLKDPTSEDYLTVSEAGVKVSGVKAAIEAADKLDNPITVTGVNVGNLTNGTTLEQGQSIEAILREMLMKRIDAKANKPTVSISNSGTPAGTYEVGTNINPVLAHMYTDGKFTGATSDYNLNQDAGCKEGATTYYRDDTALGSNTDTYQLLEGTVSYKCTTAYGADTVEVKDNLGSPSSVKIDAGTATSGTISFTGKRYGYYGGQSEVGFTANSANIKALAEKSFNSFTKITLGAGMKQIVIAFPESWGTIKEVKDDNGMNAVITTAYKKQFNATTVEGANSEEGVAYNVYILTADKALGPVSHTITIGK